MKIDITLEKRKKNPSTNTALTAGEGGGHKKIANPRQNNFLSPRAKQLHAKRQRHSIF